MATETVRTVFLVLFGLSVIWVIACIIRNDPATIVRALVITLLTGGAFFYLNQTKLQTLTFSAIKDDIFPPKPEYFTFDKREINQGGVTTLIYSFSEPGPRLVLDMERGGKYLTVTDIRPLNRTLAYVGLPAVEHGARELSAITGSTLDADYYRWEDYELGVMTIERGIGRNITTAASYPSILQITIRRK